MRVRIEQLGVTISRVITCANETTGTSTWSMTVTKHNDTKMCGIEIFTVEDGRQAHCWNTPYADGRWR